MLMRSAFRWGMCVAAVLLCCSLTATPASAGEFGRCMTAKPKKQGNWANSSCTTEVVGGKYEWVEGVAETGEKGSKAESPGAYKFKKPPEYEAEGKGVTLTLTDQKPEVTLTCKELKIMGKIAEWEEAKDTSTTFTGCSTPENGKNVECASGAAKGTISTTAPLYVHPLDSAIPIGSKWPLMEQYKWNFATEKRELEKKVGPPAGKAWLFWEQPFGSGAKYAEFTCNGGPPVVLEGTPWPERAATIPPFPPYHGENIIDYAGEIAPVNVPKKQFTVTLGKAVEGIQDLFAEVVPLNAGKIVLSAKLAYKMKEKYEVRTPAIKGR